MNSTTKMAKVTLSDIETRIDAAHISGWTYEDLELANAVEETGLTIREWMDRVRENYDVEDDLENVNRTSDSAANFFRAAVREQFRDIFNGKTGPKQSPYIQAQSSLAD
ncbi:MAG: hypothetical protein KBD00_02285 [Candidatus Peribacteraceae bacterium]|nr:hypothetical protein [Candidatus Peribacteraceae bacterium]